MVSLANRAQGAYGEDRAAAWYLANGYEVLDRNWRCASGEIDLVCQKGSTIVFCEVKTRASTAFGVPAEAVNRSKQQRLRRLAIAWLDSTGPRRRGELRFDVASVISGKIEVIERAF